MLLPLYMSLFHSGCEGKARNSPHLVDIEAFHFSFSKGGDCYVACGFSQ